MTFGKMLARACDSQKISHYRFAQLLGVQQSRVPQILKAKNLTERTFKQCVKALGLELQVKLVRRRA